MNNKCIYLRIKTKNAIKYGFCKKYNKEVSVFCKCNEIEYKERKALKKTTYKHSKKEKKRFSIIYQD